MRSLSAPTAPSPIPDANAFAEQKQLVEAALRLDAAPGAPLAAPEVCAEAGIEPSVFEQQCDTAEERPPAFYDLPLVHYHMLTDPTTGYDAFSFQERLPSFCSILLYSLGEPRAFVQATCDSRLRYRSPFPA